jgi:hypothetical protein
MLGDGEETPGDGEVVIGREQGDQAECKAAAGLGETKAIKARPAVGYRKRFWRSRWLPAACWRPGSAGGWEHEAGAESGCEGSKGSVPPAGSDCHRPLLPHGI